MERMCTGRGFQVTDTETENAREEKLLVIPDGLTRRLVLEERMHLGKSILVLGSYFTEREVGPCDVFSM